MKRIVFLTCIGSLALALTAWGAPKGERGHRSAKGGGAHSAHVASARGGGHGGGGGHSAHDRGGHSTHVATGSGGGHHGGRGGHAVTLQHFGSHRGGHSVARASHSRSSHLTTANTRSARGRSHASEHGTVTHGKAATRHERNVARATTRPSSRAEIAKTGRGHTARANVNTGGGNLAASREKNLSLGRNVAVNRGGQNVGIVNDWHRSRFNDRSYTAFYNYTPQWHDRGWWNNHYSNIIFVLGGWWYWNTGYWYPALGYDPYAYYWYDGPIYGYANLSPDRIIVNVQIQLRDDGYYFGRIDGILGPQTRAALATFQADNGLAVTSAVDRPTIRALGLA